MRSPRPQQRAQLRRQVQDAGIAFRRLEGQGAPQDLVELLRNSRDQVGDGGRGSGRRHLRQIGALFGEGKTAGDELVGQRRQTELVHPFVQRQDLAELLLGGQVPRRNGQAGCGAQLLGPAKATQPGRRAI